MSVRFVTIVPHIENLELRKDTGQIPYQMHRVFGYESILVSYFYTLAGGRKAGKVAEPPTTEAEILKEYPFLVTEVPGLKMHFLPNRGRGKFYEKAIYEYILEEAKNIDILNLFHLGSENIFYALAYQFKNPKGKVYLKLDIDIAFYKSQQSLFNLGGKLGSLKKFAYHQLLLPYFFRKVKLISAESSEGLHYFTKRFKLNLEQVKLIPNGVDLERIITLNGSFKNFEEKENIILTVGRIGNVQKNHELLLHSISQLPIGNWKVYFAGPIELGFKKYIASFFETHPHLTESIVFTGNITDPATLYQLYNRAKIFCMPSKWEGFPLAAVEAAIFGNVLVLSDQIYAADTLTDFGKNGFKFEDGELVETLTQLMADEKLQKELMQQTVLYAKTTFSWQKIIQDLHSTLSENER